MKFFCLALVTALALVSCSPGPRPDLIMAPQLREAACYLPLIREDADLRDAKALDIALAMARAGAPMAAFDLASEMKTPLRLSALYRLAVLSAKEGDLASSHRAMDAAEKGMEQYPLNPPRVPDIDRAAAYAVLRSSAESRKKFDLLGNPYDRNEALARIRAAEILRASDPLGVPGPPLIVPEVTTAWCQRAVQATADQARPYLEKALANSRDGFPVFRPRMLIECAEAEGKLGNDQARQALLREAAFVAENLGDRTEIGPMERARVGLAMAQAGMRDPARAVLEQAAVASRLCASYFQPAAMVMVAEGWWELGEKDKANAMWLEAAKVALVHPHPNARAVNAIYVLLSISKYQPEIFPELAAILDRIKRGEGGEGSANLTLSPEIQDAVSKTQKALYKDALEKDKKNAAGKPSKDSKTKKQK